MVFADKLLQNGFRLATRAGISIAIDDMLVPKEKYGLIERAEKEVKEIEQQLLSGDLDLAVHSLKDLPTAITGDLDIAAVTSRR